MRTVRYFHLGIAVVTVILIVYGSWVPFHFESIGVDVATERLRSILGEPVRWQEGRVDWAINSLITIPLGFCAIGAGLAGRRTGTRLLASSALVLGGSMCLSITVELGQIWLNGRVASMKDVVAQTIGAVGGITGYGLFGARFDEWLNDFFSDQGPEDRTQWILNAYVVGLFGYSMLPLDVVMSLGELAQKFDTGKVEIIPFSHSYASFSDAIYGYGIQAILSIPIGMFGVVAYRRNEYGPRPFLDAAIWAIGILVAIEAAQMLVVSRFTSTTDVITGAVGVFVGVAVMRRVRRRYPIDQGGPMAGTATENGSWAAKWLATSAAYATIIAAIFWYPYDFTDDKALIKERLLAFWSMPFLRIFESDYLHSLSSLLRMVSWFFPLGGLAAMCVTRMAHYPRARQVAYVVAAIWTVGWALLMELGQILLPSRFADITDAMVCGAGGLVGLFMVGRLAGADRSKTQVSAPKTVALPPKQRS
jgi:VanZ family protein